MEDHRRSSGIRLFVLGVALLVGGPVGASRFSSQPGFVVVGVLAVVAGAVFIVLGVVRLRQARRDRSTDDARDDGMMPPR